MRFPSNTLLAAALRLPTVRGVRQLNGRAVLLGGIALFGGLACSAAQDAQPGDPAAEGTSGATSLPTSASSVSAEVLIRLKPMVIDRHPGGQPAVVAFVDGETRVRDEHYDASGHKLAEVVYSDQGRRATWKRYHANGDTQAAYYVVLGKKQGQEWRFDEQGHRIAIVPYRDGLRDGVQFEFLPTGEKRTELKWAAGEPSGPMTTFYPDGTREAVVNIVNERKHGVEVQYGVNGKVRAEVPYHYGEIEGKATYYDTEGFKYSTIDYLKGVPHGEEVRLYKGGAVRMRIPWRQGERHGMATLYSPSGFKEADYPYVHGKIDGYERAYDRQGRWTKAVEYHDDIPGPRVYVLDEQGSVRALLTYTDINKGDGEEVDYHVAPPGSPTPATFDPEHPVVGAVRMKATLLNDRKEGEATLYDPRGNVAARMNFSAGKLNGVELRYYPPEAIELYREHTPAALYWSGQLPGDKRTAAAAPKVKPKRGKGKAAGKATQSVEKPVVNGALRPMAKFHWENDELKGMAVLYWPNGRPQAEFPYDIEAGTGLERRWDYRGRLRFAVPIAAGKKEGLATLWSSYTPTPDDLARDAGKSSGKGKKQRKAKASQAVAGNDGLTKVATLQFKDNLQDGDETRFDAKGKVSKIYVWQKGKLVGVRDPRRGKVELHQYLDPTELETLAKDDLLNDPQAMIALARRWQHQRKQKREDQALAAGTMAIRKGTIETYFKDAPGKVQSRFPASGNGTEILYHRNGQIRMTAPLVNGQRNGVARIYDETGTLWAMVPFVNGGKQGVEKRFARTGERIAEYPYRADQPVGVARTWFADGTKQSEYNFERIGRRTEVQYHHSGEVRLRVPMIDGKRQGLAVLFTETGVKWAEIPYLHGNRQGVEVRFDNEGRRIREIVWDRGQQVSERAVSSP